MNSVSEPATEVQLSALRKFGYVPDHPLSRSEAATLLLDYQHAQAPQHTGHEPYHLRKMVEQAKHDAKNPSEIEPLVRQRQEFWLDTCREVMQMKVAWAEILNLYKDHGCRFATPTHEQAQEILDALDCALPTWDRDHPELFYQTMELNFPELAKGRKTIV